MSYQRFESIFCITKDSGLVVKNNGISFSSIIFNPYPAKLIYLNFSLLEVVSRYRDSQPRVVENYSKLFNLNINICKSWCLDKHFFPNNSDFVDKKKNKNDNSRDQQDKA